METRPKAENSDKKSNFLPIILKNWKVNSVVLLTSVTTATLLVLSSGRSEALEIAFLQDSVDESNPIATRLLPENQPIKAANTAKHHQSNARIQLVPVDRNESDWREYTVKHDNDFAALAARVGFEVNDVQSLLSTGGEVKHLNSLYYGDKIRVNIADNNRVVALEYDIYDSKRLRVERVINADNGAESFLASIINRPLTTRTVRVSGVVNETLYQAAISAGLSDKKTRELVRIFDCSIDYSKDTKKGDTFAVIYEERYRGDEKIEDGPIQAAEFVNNEKAYHAILYAVPNDKPRYYSPEGIGLRKTFLRNPVDYPLVSSGFDPARKHPTLHKIRAHKGVDYAARLGTPIKSTADGFVKFKGNKGSYGKTIVIQHNRQFSTLYAHMHNYVSSLKPGDRVRQGDIIGFVGKTGRATGTHLHYEFHINGKHVDPLKVNHPVIVIPERNKYEFFVKSELLLSQIRTVEEVEIAWSGNTKRDSTVN
jgi:murein DD-endopeptidase MepM/ murein hydrolase activator NlpD